MKLSKTIQDKFNCGAICYEYRQTTKRYQEQLKELKWNTEWKGTYNHCAYVLFNTIGGLSHLSDKAFKLLEEANLLWDKNPNSGDMASLRKIRNKELKLAKLCCIQELCKPPAQEKKAEENRKLIIAHIEEQIKNNVKDEEE